LRSFVLLDLIARMRNFLQLSIVLDESLAKLSLRRFDTIHSAAPHTQCPWEWPYCSLTRRLD